MPSANRAGSLFVSGMLAAAGGFFDGFTYLGHGHVFANAMTANAILLTAACFAGSWRKTLIYLPPIVACLAAVWASRAIHLTTKRRGAGCPYAEVLLMEMLVLAVLSWLNSTVTDILFTSSIAFVASLQMQTFREVNGRPYSSTFTTGNLRILSDAAFTWVFEKRTPESTRILRDFAVIVGAFLLGAILGGATTRQWGNRALWCNIGILAAVTIYIYGGYRTLSVAVRISRSPSRNRKGTIEHISN